ncbi:trypsin-like serine protease [Litorivicinus lipolyticus]|uniref:Trypsin-like serine protease n=1 Tax=Litorivicinus lipolyticus TaxID=418701 RepID=A0A5Q2Q8G0_9GAMM|nr:trypsin-like peptidase domain-containing protein [Litorivicinus lipolyticus]QGG80969.1 trypsin-like serine protease [Litorivicinus lipolyticus]
MNRLREQIAAIASTIALPAVAGLAIAMSVLWWQGRDGAPQLSLNVLPSAERSMSTPPPGSYREAVSRAAPAVVNIHTSTQNLAADHPLLSDATLRQYLNSNLRQDRSTAPLGSGVIISNQGHILTNHHVIADAPVVLVELRDGRRAIARRVGSDPESDLAVLQIELPNLPVIPIAQSPSQIGDSVLAIGNPFGVGQSVTKGILSATGRIAGLATFEDFIQTDAAINPGNSGGALTNIFGELIGINSAIFSRGGGSQGIGFAIPTSLALDVMQQILTFGRVIRGFLGIEVEALSDELGKTLGVMDGLVITTVYRDSPAQIAGMLPGDVLAAIDGRPVTNGRTAMLQITDMAPGQKTVLTVLREQTQLDLNVEIGVRPQAQ